MALILFDYDGVLADTLDDLVRFGQEACDRLGVDHRVRKEDLNNLEVMSFSSFGRACGVPNHLVDSFVGICLNLFAEKTSPPAIFPGLRDVLQSLALHHRIGIVTTNTSQNVQAFLAQHGLEGLVHEIYGVDSPGSKAQKISMARKGWMQDQEPGPVCMVGDSISDVLAAKEAGVTSIAVTWGHQALERLLRGEPDHVIDSPHQLIEIIQGL